MIKLKRRETSRGESAQANYSAQAQESKSPRAQLEVSTEAAAHPRTHSRADARMRRSNFISNLPLI
jgi:hypothetical protein